VQVFVDSPDSLLASLLSAKGTGKLILVTGQSGSGKTYWCQELANLAKIGGFNAVGLVSPAVFEGGVKVGIDLVDIKSGSRNQLAVHRGSRSPSQSTLDWDFNDEALTWGNSILGRLDTCQLLILDEIGPLELLRGAGLSNAMGLISARGYGLACVVVRPSLIKIAMGLWPWGIVSRVHTNIPSEASA
jgi:nucleoside-triphosphatase